MERLSDRGWQLPDLNELSTEQLQDLSGDLDFYGHENPQYEADKTRVNEELIWRNNQIKGGH